jgi:YdjC-like protein
VHMNPAIFSVVEELLPRYGIDRLRLSRESFPIFAVRHDPAALVRRFNLIKWSLLRWFSRQIRPRLISNEDFFGILYSGRITKKALMGAIASASPARSMEICIHPGFPAPASEKFYPRPGYNAFISSPARQIEHDLLVDREIAARVHERGLTLRAFNGRPKPT